MAQASYNPGAPAGRVRFEAIGEAWKIVSSDFPTWIMSSLIMLGGSVVIFVPTYFFMVFGMVGTSFTSSQGGRGQNAFPAAFFVVFAAVWVVLFVGFTVGGGLWMAGMERLALLKIRGVPAPITELFNLEGQWMRIAGFSLLLPLAFIPVVVLIFGIFGLLAGLSYRFVPALSLVFVIFGYLLVLVASLVFQSLSKFGPLLIVDQKLSITDAFVLSFKTLWPHVLPTVGVVICATLLSALGELACGIGLIFTMPILYVTTAVVYNDFFQTAKGGFVGEAAKE
jgi:hypothetical protein